MKNIGIILHWTSPRYVVKQNISYYGLLFNKILVKILSKKQNFNFLEVFGVFGQSSIEQFYKKVYIACELRKNIQTNFFLLF